MLSKKSVRFSKRVAAVAATVALSFAGLVAGVASSASASDTDVNFNVRATRTLTSGVPATIRPGETISLSLSAYMDARSNSSTVVSDIAVGDVLSFEPNFSSSLTPSYTRFSWYVTGVSGGCYDIEWPTTQTITWTEAMKNCGGGSGAGYIAPYWNANLTNNTDSDVTFTVDPKFLTPNAPGGISSAEPGFRINNQATFEASNVSSYTASSSDTSIYFDFWNGKCVSRDLSAGSAFAPSATINADGTPVSTVDNSVATYADSNLSVSHLPSGSTSAEDLPGSAKLLGYAIESGRLVLTTDGEHNFGSIYADIEGTGVAELDAIDSAYSWDVSRDTLRVNASVALSDTSFVSLSSGTVTGERGGQFNAVPAGTQGIKVRASSYVYRPVTNSVYTMAVAIVDNSDGVTSVERACGLAAPSFTIDSATSTYNTIAVSVDQVPGATSYQCVAYNSANTVVYTGSLQETSRASGSKCYMYGLTASTAYVVKMKSYSSFEGEGQLSDGVNHTTIANSGGGGGGWVPPSMVTPTLLAPGGASAIAVSSPAEKSMNSAVTINDAARSAAGANGDMFYYSVAGGIATVVHNTASGADSRFAGTGSVSISNVTSISSVNWTGLKGAGFSILYRKSNGSMEAKWGSLTTASGMKTQEITQAKIASFCTTAAGAGYDMGMLSGTSTIMTTPFVRVSCANSTDPTKPEKVILANVAASSSAPLVKTSAQLTTYTSTANPCTTVSISSNKAATAATSAILVIATTHAKYSSGGGSWCMSGMGTVLKREIISISGAGKKLASTNPAATAIGADIGVFSAAPGKAANTWVVIASTNGSMMTMPASKYIVTVDAKAKAVKGKNITFASASSASNSMFSNYSMVSIATQLSTGTILGLRSGSATGSENLSWAAVTINVATGVVTTGKVVTVTASNYTGTQGFARNMNMTSFTSDSKKLNVYVLSNPEAKKYKVATWTMPTK
jgi:hypothetical protein